MSDTFWLVIAIIIAGWIISAAIQAIANRLKDFTDAYQRRTKWQADQAVDRARDKAEKKREKTEERFRRFWQALWETLQRLQQEYLALERQGFEGTDGGTRREHAQRLAARIALLWIRFLNVYDKYTENLEGFPTRARETENQVVQHYVERYLLAAGVTLPTRFTPEDVQWWEGLEELLNQRLRDLNTPSPAPAPTSTQ